MQQSHLILIHGLANKPPPEDLSRIWRDALSASTPSDNGLNTGAIGVTTSLVYWADLFYKSPLAISDYESINDELSESARSAVNESHNEWIESFHARIADENDESEVTGDEPVLDEYERIPLPWSLKKRLMRRVAIEAHDYLFNERDIRNIILERTQSAIAEAPAKARIVILGHSMGTMIGYDVLTHVRPVRPIAGFMTVGSPLGLDEIQDKLDHSRENGFPDSLQGEWVNVFDPFDPVSRMDARLSNDFKRAGEDVVVDVKEENWGRWRHSATKYFKGAELRRHLRRLLNRE